MYRRLISLKEAAEILNLSKSTLYKMVEAGRIEVKRFGKKILFDPEAVGIKEILDQPESDLAHKIEVKVEKPVFQSILKDLIPELDRAFKNAPAYGDVGFRVVFHESQVVRVETTSSVSRLVNKNGKS